VSALAIAAGVTVVIGAALQAATGFGFGLVAAPLLYAAAGPPEAVGLLVVLGLEVNLLTLGTERRRPQPLMPDTALLLAWAVPGLALGIYALRSLDAATLQVALTVGVFATLAVRRYAARRSAEAQLEPHLPRGALPVTGVTSGALAVSTSTSGPPLVLYLLARGARPGQTRDTLTASFLGLVPLAVLALAISGTTSAIPDPLVLAALVPLTLLGHLAGRPVFARLAKGRYELALTVVLVATALGGLVTVLV